MFRRRERRSVGRITAEFFYPRGGWSRAAQYVRHRLLRLSGPPEAIARGIFAGAFTVFTPFFGFHFITAAIIAKLLRGNILAALLATFIGNPLTYVPIAVISLETGHFLLGSRRDMAAEVAIGRAFGTAWRDLRHNFTAMFTPERADWDGLLIFYQNVFFPWMIGGILPGIAVGLGCYYLSVPVIRAYQTRRRQILANRVNAMRAAAKGEGNAG